MKKALDIFAVRFRSEYAPLYDRKPVQSSLKGCKDLQKRLGDINDVATGLPDQASRRDVARWPTLRP